MEPLYCMKNIVINKPETLTSKFLINIKFIMKGIKSKEQEITSILEKSLMNNENNKRKIFLENQTKELINTKENHEKQLQLYDKKHIEIVESYLDIQKRFDSLSGKQRKKMIIVACPQKGNEKVFKIINENNLSNIAVWFDEAHHTIENWSTKMGRDYNDSIKFFLEDDNIIKNRIFTSASPNINPPPKVILPLPSISNKTFPVLSFT